MQTAGVADFPSTVSFSDFGFNVGDSNDIVIKIVDDDKGLIANEQGQEILYKSQDGFEARARKCPQEFTGALLPGYDNLTAYTGLNTTNIGSSYCWFWHSICNNI